MQRPCHDRLSCSTSSRDDHATHLRIDSSEEERRFDGRLPHDERHWERLFAGRALLVSLPALHFHRCSCKTQNLVRNTISTTKDLQKSLPARSSADFGSLMTIANLVTYARECETERHMGHPGSAVKVGLPLKHQPAQQNVLGAGNLGRTPAGSTTKTMFRASEQPPTSSKSRQPRKRVAYGNDGKYYDQHSCGTQLA